MSWMSVEPGATRLPNVAKVFALLVLPRPSRMKIELPGSSQPSATRPLPETIISTHSPSFDKNAQFVLHRRMVSPSAARGEQKRGSPSPLPDKGTSLGKHAIKPSCRAVEYSTDGVPVETYPEPTPFQVSWSSTPQSDNHPAVEMTSSQAASISSS